MHSTFWPERIEAFTCCNTVSNFGSVIKSDWNSRWMFWIMCVSCRQSSRRVCLSTRSSPRCSAWSINCCVRACLPLRGGNTSAVASRSNSSSSTASCSLYRRRSQLAILASASFTFSSCSYASWALEASAANESAKACMLLSARFNSTKRWIPERRFSRSSAVVK